MTTRTDSVNKYSATLQTTLYNFSSTNTTPEICVGVVKASGSFPNNPAQHTADLTLLDSGDVDKQELKPAFVDLVTGTPKPIDCIRVDGASDEGPGHDEGWTVRHGEEEACNLGHYSKQWIVIFEPGRNYKMVACPWDMLLFIPSTLGGSCYHPETGCW